MTIICIPFLLFSKADKAKFRFTFFDLAALVFWSNSTSSIPIWCYCSAVIRSIPIVVLLLLQCLSVTLRAFSFIMKENNLKPKLWRHLRLCLQEQVLPPVLLQEMKGQES